MTEIVLTNARIVLGDEVREGSVVVRDGQIVDIGGRSASGEDMDGDYLVPGLVELHTDHIEPHFAPRPGVRWNATAALQAHDAQIAAAGITTVFDALRVGVFAETITAADMRLLGEAIASAKAEDRLRADHLIHLRCEVSAPACETEFEAFKRDPNVRLISVMDHAPGQRQFASIDAYRVYHLGKTKKTLEEFNAFCAQRVEESETYAPGNRVAIAEFCREHGVTMASHDDATLEHVEESKRLGVKVAEFPTTMEAAQASHEAGLAVLMGAPNIVRGVSHSGNISAGALAEAGLLDILSSDYVPVSLMHAAFKLGQSIALPEALAMVSRNPAQALGMDDRGEIAIGKRGDMVQVRLANSVPIVRKVFREGRRVA